MEREALYSLIYLEIISSLRSHLALQREELSQRERGRSPSPSSLPTRGVYAALAGLGSKLLAQLQALPYLIFSARDELHF